jgi:hypothetical protein
MLYLKEMKEEDEEKVCWARSLVFHSVLYELRKVVDCLYMREAKQKHFSNKLLVIYEMKTFWYLPNIFKRKRNEMFAASINAFAT